MQKKFLNDVEILSVDKTSMMRVLQEIADRIRKEHSGVKEIILFGSFS
jgi:predicted nucleotidyltransferase